MSKIFLNYRRQDSAAFAGRLYDHFVEHFGQDSVFIDIDTISLGVDFVEAIQEKMAICEVLLVLIGKQWLTCSDTAGRRLDNPNDFVRLEIVAAKDRGIRIIPVLVDGAEMPREELLPDALRFLARRNATELSYLRFRDDVNRLIRSIENVINTGRRISEVGPVASPESHPLWRPEQVGMGRGCHDHSDGWRNLDGNSRFQVGVATPLGSAKDFKHGDEHRFSRKTSPDRPEVDA